MPLRNLLRYLANNERLVQKIADSKPIRRAAQLTVALFYRSKEKIQADPEMAKKWVSFIKKFKNNIYEEIEEGKKQIKKK